MDSFEAQQPVESREWTLEPETEYRFELDPGTSLAVKLLNGQAEVFGAELAEGKPYIFGCECKAAIFTWKGCIIQVTGRPSTEYVSDETPMFAYANLHIALEQMRVRALSSLNGSSDEDDEYRDSDPTSRRAEPPRVLIVGPENSGKTTIAKILANYAVRAGQGWSPLLVNVDPSEGAWIIPGTISAAQIHSPISTYSPASPLGSAATSAPMVLSSNALIPLVYWYGHSNINRNHLLMERLVRTLGHHIDDKWHMNPEGRVSGLIVDTPSSFSPSSSSGTEHRQQVIRACVETLKINVIVVVGHEKLYVEMQRLYGTHLNVVKIPKSGGVVELDFAYRERIYNHQLHTYMYGQSIPAPSGIPDAALGGEALTDLVLAPSSIVIKFDDITIYRIGAETMAPTSALPIGATRVVSEMQPVRVDPAKPGSGLLNTVLALLAPFNPDENERYDEELLDLNVMGFLIVTNIDLPNRKMTILAPNQGSVVGRTALAGSFEWQEQ